MLDHIMINVSDFRRSREFYQTVLAPLGYEVRKQIATGAGFGVPHGHGKSPDPAGEFWISEGRPQEPRPHIAFNAASRAIVDEFYARALVAGGRDNGPPGVRPQYHANYYGAFVLDPDGYNVEAVCHLAP